MQPAVYISLRISLLSLAISAYSLSIAQQSVIRGIVSIQNSETLTGKRQYVSNAQVEDEAKKATPTITGNNGEFKLVYVGIGEKKTVSFQVKKTGLQVVDPTKLSGVAGQEAIINISMANPDSITAYRVRLFNIGKTETEKKLESQLLNKNQQLLSLRKDGQKNAASIKILQDELDAIRQKINQQATGLAGRYATLNLDDASRQFRLAFMHFQKGNTDLALTVLSRMNLPATVSAIKAHPGNDTATARLAKDASEALALKAELHKTSFDFDSAAACYELALQLQPANETYLSELADLLPDLGRNQDARINYNKALMIYRRLASTQPEIYVPKVAETLNKIGLYAFGWDTGIDNTDPYFDLAKSKAAFTEAIGIYRQLVKKDPTHWKPYLAGALDNLAGRISANADLDTGILEAIPVYQEAIDSYQQLVKDNPNNFEPALGKTLISLTAFYRKKFEFTNASATVQEAIALYRRLAINKSFDKATAYADYCEELAAYIEKDKNKFMAEEITALQLAEKYRRLAVTDPAYLKDLAKALNSLGLMLQQSAAQLFIHDNAKLNLQEAASIYKQLAKKQPAVYLSYLAETLDNLGDAYHSNYNSSQAAIAFLEAMEIYQQLAKDKPTTYKKSLTTIQGKLEDLAINEFSFDNAGDALLEEAISVYRRLAKIDPASYGSYPSALQARLAGNYGSHSWNLLMEGSFEAAEKMAIKGIQAAPRQAWIKTNLAHALLLQGKYAEAVKVYTELKNEKDESGKSFVAICLEDLDALEKKNITNKDVKRIRDFLIE